MIIDYRFDAHAWENFEARHAMSVVAPLLDVAFRFSAPGALPVADAAVVFVGDPVQAPADCAAIVPVAAWPIWQPSTVRVHARPGGFLLGPERDLGSEATSSAMPGAWLRAIAFVVQREEELLEHHRDEWECFSGFSSRLHELGIIDQPLVNDWASQLEARVRQWIESRGHTPRTVPRWKNGARFAVALTHDVDWVRRFSLPQSLRLLRQAHRLNSYAFRHGLSASLDSVRHLGTRQDPYCSFDRWAREESELGFRSTFYFCPYDPQPRHEYDPTYRDSDRVDFEGQSVTVARLMETLAARGFEIGLHGSYQSHRSADELARQKYQIERASGATLKGLRQHFLRFDLPFTWSAQEAAGFRYDTTLGYNEATGFRAGISAPFHPWNPQLRGPYRLLELPLTLMDGTLFRTLKLNGTLAAGRTRAHLDAVERVGGLAVLLWHPNATDTDRYAGWWDAYRETLADLAARNVWVAPAGEIADWWIERESRLCESA